MNVSGSLRQLVVLSFVLVFPSSVRSMDLTDYLPYADGSTSTLTDESGLTVTFGGGGNDLLIWKVTGAEEDLQVIFQLNDSGLSLLTEVGLVPDSGTVLDVETFNSPWIIAPRQFELGAEIVSSGAYEGTESGEAPWSGTTLSMFSVGPAEEIATPLGTFTALKFTFVNEWEETGVGFTGSGSTTQTWWAAEGEGLVRFHYDFEETYIEDGESETEQGRFEFQLVANNIVEPNNPGPNLPPDALVTIPDLRLKAEVLRTLERASNDPASAEITVAEMQSLTRLTANVPIADLTGLEVATNLTDLNLSLNGGEGDITNLTPIAGLTQLVHLAFVRNQVQDISPLAGLTNLVTLRMFANDITDISVIANMPQLNLLWMGDNRIVDLGPVSGLTNLQFLSAYGNEISDLEPLRGLTRLQEVFLGTNQIASLEPLTPLPNLVRLSLRENEVNDVTVLSDKQFLSVLELDGNQIADITPLAPLARLQSASVQSNCLNVTPGAPDRQVIDGWIVNGARVTFEPQKTSSGGVHIPDPNLEAALREALGKSAGAITQTDLQGLTTFDGNLRNIEDLTGLEYATNLVSLDLGRNNISDLTPLAGLTKLTELTLFTNAIRDIEPLSGLVNLTSLLILKNEISSVDHLANLKKLQVLRIGWNRVQNLDPLAELTNLIALELDFNGISNVQSLQNLTQLRSLTLSNNNLQDVAPLGQLTSLTVLRLNRNSITDLTPLSTLTSLRTATVEDNRLVVTPGTPDRKVIDDWISGGTNVTFEPQRPLTLPMPVALSIARRDDHIHLEWASQINRIYTAEGSADLKTWALVEGAMFTGTGGMLEGQFPMQPGAQFFRIIGN